MTAPLTAEQSQMVADNLGLVGWVLGRWPAGDGQPYDRDDAFQAGVVGLARAVQLFDPGKGFKFSTYAVGWIRAAIQRDRGRFDGVDTRRAVEHGDPLPERPMAWDAAVTLAGDDTASLDDILPAPHSDPAPVAIMRADLGAAIRAALAACNDDLDRALVAAIVHHDPFGPVAAAAGRSPQTGHNRAARLLTIMREAAA